MFVFKILALCLLFVVCSVSSDDSERYLKSNYKFNHPPQTENFQSIPVAIVYDEPGSTSLQLAAKKATTYHPKFRAVTEPNRYEESTFLIDTDEFFEEEQKRVQQLRNKLRKAKLHVHKDISRDDATKSTPIFQSFPEDLMTVGHGTNEKYNTVYKEINRSKHGESKRKTEEFITTDRTEIEPTYPNTVQEETAITISVPDKTSATIKEDERNENLQTNIRGRKKGPRSKPWVQTDTTSVGALNKQMATKKINGRGSIRYRNNEQQSSTTSSSTKATTFRNYDDDLVKFKENAYTTTEQYLSSLRQKMQPRSDKPTNDLKRIDPLSENSQVQNNEHGIANTGQGITDRSYEMVQSKIIQGGQQTPLLLESSDKAVEIKSNPNRDTTTEIPIGLNEGITDRSYEVDQSKILQGGQQISVLLESSDKAVEIKSNTSRDTTTEIPIGLTGDVDKIIDFMTTTDNGNYSNQPMSVLQQINYNKKTSTLLPPATQEEGYDSTLPIVLQINETIPSFPAFTTTVMSDHVLNDPAKTFNIKKYEIPLEVPVETIKTTTEKLLSINGNHMKLEQQKRTNNFQGQNEGQIPVVIVYDTSAPSLPAKRSKTNKIINGRNAESKTTNFNEDVKTQNAPNTGNVTKNLNAERRTKGRNPVVPILESENHVYAQSGKFNYRYESGDGTNVFQEGSLKPFEDDVTGEAVKGGFSYTDKDGNDFSLSYTADENGYRPVGAHLPTPPPIPPAIARALAYLATKSTPNPDEITERTLDYTH